MKGNSGKFGFASQEIHIFSSPADGHDGRVTPQSGLAHKHFIDGGGKKSLYCRSYLRSFYGTYLFYHKYDSLVVHTGNM